MLRFGKKSVFWKWIISYISIVLVLLVCNVVTNVRNLKVMEERQAQMNEVVLQQLTERVYDNVLQIEKVRERIMVNDHYHCLRRASASQYKYLAYRRYALYCDLQDFLAVNGRCSKIIVYFSNGDYVVTSDTVNTSELYWRVFQNEIGLGWDEWTTLLKGDYDILYTKKTGSGADTGMIYGRTLQSEQLGQKVNVFFLYTADDIEQMLMSHTGEETVSVAIKGSADEVILHDMGGLLNTEEDRLLVENAVLQTLPQVKLTNGDEIILTYDANTFKGNVCLISSENIYMESLRQSQQVYAVTFMATILLSMVLIVLFAKNNYKPLKELMDVLGPEEWISVKHKNEFALVQEKVSKVQNENKYVNQTLRRQNKLFRGEYFAKLLMGGKVNLPEKQLEEFYDISFVSDSFAVMLFYVESYEEEQEEGADLNRAQFILGNVFHEVLEDLECRVYQTKVSDLMILVINMPESAGDGRRILDSAMTRGTEFIDKHFDMEYSVSISNVHQGKTELSLGYQEALQALEFKRLYGLDDMVYYSDIIELSGTGYYYPIEVEQDLIRQIQASNYEAAKAVYENVVEENMNGDTVASQDTLRCLMYDLLGTVLKALEEKKEDEKFTREMRPAKRMSACQGLTEMRETFEDILYRTCEYMNVKSGTEDKEALCEQIKDYIRKNYYDPSLSVTSIAEHFNLAPVMMSKMFRETVGEKLPVVVSEVRLEAAKKLMCQSDESLGEIAEKAGFGSVRTFTRIFKQVEDCTPGQWRESHS
ncbi:MAG: helix-turn-helix transcriptional regulator [Lachnospiraceae bacterium]|nr:helix-turn-helix transcriptional regulator [Lachnospiraceae bacterium]